MKPFCRLTTEAFIVTIICEVMSITSAEAQSMKPAITLSEIVKAIAESNINNLLEQGPGWAQWSAKGHAWTNIVATSSNPNSPMANLLTAMKGSEPLAVLLTPENKGYYRYFQGGAELLGDWKISARATLNNGRVDRVDMWNRNGQKLIIGSFNGLAAPQFIATPLSPNQVAVLLLDDSGTNFSTTLIYDMNRRTYLLASNFSLNPKNLSYILASTKNKQWIEYAFSQENNQLTAIATHDSLPGVLKRAVFDLTDDGIADIFVQAQGDSFRVKRMSGRQPLAVLNPSEHAKTLIEAATTTALLWSQARQQFYSFQALGYTFPLIKTLPR